MNTLYGDPIWYKDLSVLFGKRILEFFPTADMTFTERVNATVRFIIYATIIMYAYNRDPRYALYGAAGVAIISLAYATKEEGFQSPDGVGSKGRPDCVRPTKENPFGNVLLTDYADRPDRPPACDYDDVKEEMEYAFNQGLYRNMSDVYDKASSQRQFYSMPSTTIPNDTKKFTDFVFNNVKNCKTDPSVCTGYN
jgi:hypothetical protein